MEKEWKPSVWYYAAVWIPVTALAGAQGWLTGDTVMMVMHWLGH